MGIFALLFLFLSGVFFYKHTEARPRGYVGVYMESNFILMFVCFFAFVAMCLMYFKPTD